MEGDPERPWSLCRAPNHQQQKICPHDTYAGEVCKCTKWADRLSASLITARHSRFMDQLSIFSMRTGVVLSPYVGLENIFCVWQTDGGTMGRRCDPTDQNCIPGCFSRGVNGKPSMWCSLTRSAYCTWPPDGLADMLRQQEEQLSQRRVGAHYNEVVVDTASWDPARWIEAIFYVVPESDEEREQCQQVGALCEEYAKQLHTHYVEHFRLCSTRVPLLRLNRSNWKMPFDDVSTG